MPATSADPTRKPGFREWFRGSKVVDARGKPLVVYHGSGTNIERFSYEFTDQGNDELGSGFYFTTDYTEAAAYTTRVSSAMNEKLGGTDNPTVHAVYLAIRRPLDADTIGTITRKQAYDIIDLAPQRDDGLSNWGNVDYDGIDAVIAKAVAAYAKTRVNVLMALNYLANDFYPNDVEHFNAAVRLVLKYDGVRSRQSQGDGNRVHWVAWFPNQIKSVGALSFDPGSEYIANAH